MIVLLVKNPANGIKSYFISGETSLTLSPQSATSHGNVSDSLWSFHENNLGRVISGSGFAVV